MEPRRDKLFKGLNFKKDEYLKLLEKYERLQDEKRKQRYDTLYTAYGLFSDCLEYPNRTRIEHVDQFIIASKHDLKEEDLEELRKVRNLVINDVEVAIKTIFPCSRKLTFPTPQDTISAPEPQKNNSVRDGGVTQAKLELIHNPTHGVEGSSANLKDVIPQVVDDRKLLGSQVPGAKKETIEDMPAGLNDIDKILWKVERGLL